MLAPTYSDRFVDARHLPPRMVLMTLSKAIQQIDEGHILALSVSDPEARREIPAWCEKTGHQLLETTERHGLVTFYIQRRS